MSVFCREKPRTSEPEVRATFLFAGQEKAFDSGPGNRPELYITKYLTLHSSRCKK